MFEVIAIGVLVSISVFALGLSVDLVLTGDKATVFESQDLDMDLSGFEPVPQESRDSLATEVSAPPQPSESYLQALSEELQGLDVQKVDFDLSGMSDEAVRH